MRLESFALRGKHVLLEPLDPAHAPDLAAASAGDPSFYSWTYVPQGEKDMNRYIDAALAARDAGTAWPFVTRLTGTGRIIGATRYFDLEWWPWPEGHERRDRWAPDVCEIGYTWLARDSLRTAANTEAKLLMMTYAFQVWGVHRIVLHTDERNARSRSAIERIGGKFEGILRAHRLASDFTPRNSARYSIIAAEWPQVRARLEKRLEQGASRGESAPA